MIWTKIMRDTLYCKSAMPSGRTRSIELMLTVERRLAGGACLVGSARDDAKWSVGGLGPPADAF